MYFKLKYDRKHQSLYMRIDDWIFFRIHKKYKISTTTRLKKKLSQQYVDSFQITKKIDRLIYRFVISKFWRVHFVFIIIQLKLISSSSTNFFRRSRFTKSNFVFVEKKHWSRQILWNETITQQTSNDSSKNEISCEMKKLRIKTRQLKKFIEIERRYEFNQKIWKSFSTNNFYDTIYRRRYAKVFCNRNQKIFHNHR